MTATLESAAAKTFRVLGLWRRWVTRDRLILAAARLGYAARGFVYLSVGVLALMAALELRASATGSRGSMAALARAPLGEMWLIMLGAGLFCFAFWRAMQAFLDADRLGRRPKAVMQRAAQALSGLIYGALAMSVLELVDELGDLGEPDEAAEASQQAAQLMSLPYGQGLLMALGLFVVGAGIGNMVHGLEKRFHSDLDCSQTLRRWAKPTGRAGYLARGAAFALTGVYLVRAAFAARASEAKDMGAALQALESQPFGSALLVVIGAGLVAFGIFGLVEARYRVLRLPAPQ